MRAASDLALAVLLATVMALLAGAQARPHRLASGGRNGDSLVTGPVVGVLTQSVSGAIEAGLLDAKHAANGQAYIAASYVKYLESAGARVVPIHYNWTENELIAAFNKINGMLFPGGGQDLSSWTSPWMLAAGTMFNQTVAQNANGQFFPLWGTCLGFETVNVLAARDTTVLDDGFDSENLPLPLNLTAEAADSRMFGQSKALLNILGTEAVTMNNHMSGVTPAAFAGNARLTSMFNILSTNVDRKNREFVSTIEGKTMPIYATQWHPEKNIFEWTPAEQIPHTPDAITATQAMANFFVAEARRSTTHSYPDDELMNDIIWNYSPVFAGKTGSHFDQIYFF